MCMLSRECVLCARVLQLVLGPGVHGGACAHAIARTSHWTFSVDSTCAARESMNLSLTS
jgi:hypothetical protein